MAKEIDLVEIGANWYLDDLPPMMFMKASPRTFAGDSLSVAQPGSETTEAASGIDETIADAFMLEVARPHVLTRDAGTTGTTPWIEREDADA